MGEGINKARGEAPIHAQVLDDFKDDLLIVFLRRLGGSVSIPLAEVDGTEGVVLKFRVDEQRVFHFSLEHTKD